MTERTGTHGGRGVGTVCRRRRSLTGMGTNPIPSSLTRDVLFNYFPTFYHSFLYSNLQ
ncbi:hypothetical protein HanIR_Chr05g0242091 [Helianthus annuus]|nr:hypothetical protein HanIR_Chr05g0242091 [Helianthus annuus]